MKTRLVIIVAASGAAFALALPNELTPYGTFPAGLVCLAPFFAAVTLSPSHRFSAVLGAVFGGVSTVLTNYWLVFFGDFSVWTLGGTTVGYILYNAMLAPFLTAFARRPAAYRPFLLAAAWTVYELAKSSGFLGYPWGLIAYPPNTIPLLTQIVDITGIWGLSFVMALINTSLSETALAAAGHPRSGRRIALTGTWAFASVLVGVVLVYGAARLALPIRAEKHMTMVLVQQNTDPWEAGREMESVRTGMRLSREGVAAAQNPVDLVVWSESSLRWPYMESRSLYAERPLGDPFVPFVQSTRTHFLVGSPVIVGREPIEAMNSALLLAPDASVVDHYGKQHPVPFAEAVPFWEVPMVRTFFTEVVGLPAVWVMGNEYTIFETPIGGGQTVRFGAPICFEDAFPGLCRRFIRRGAELLINLTNDAWSKQVSAETHHFVVARFRAVENRRTLVRGTNAGVTAVVDAYGRIAASLPLFEEASMAVDVPVYEESIPTVYTRFGDYLPIAFLAMLLVVLATAAGRGTRKNGRGSSTFAPRPSV
jgi:apolipoprotein N-acyltransferase